eukprot:jgi/Bigna1/74039/fgenesh1_pg.27_\
MRKMVDTMDADGQAAGSWAMSEFEQTRRRVCLTCCAQHGISAEFSMVADREIVLQRLDECTHIRTHDSFPSLHDTATNESEPDREERGVSRQSLPRSALKSLPLAISLIAVDDSVFSLCDKGFIVVFPGLWDAQIALRSAQRAEPRTICCCCFRSTVRDDNIHAHTPTLPESHASDLKNQKTSSLKLKRNYKSKSSQQSITGNRPSDQSFKDSVNGTVTDAPKGRTFSCNPLFYGNTSDDLGIVTLNISRDGITPRVQSTSELQAWSKRGSTTPRRISLMMRSEIRSSRTSMQNAGSPPVIDVLPFKMASPASRGHQQGGYRSYSVY